MTTHYCMRLPCPICSYGMALHIGGPPQGAAVPLAPKDAEIAQLRADLAAAQARSAQIEARARAVVAEWSKPASEVDMAEVGSRLDDLVRVLGLNRGET